MTIRGVSAGTRVRLALRKKVSTRPGRIERPQCRRLARPGRRPLMVARRGAIAVRAAHCGSHNPTLLDHPSGIFHVFEHHPALGIERTLLRVGDQGVEDFWMNYGSWDSP